MGLLGSGVAAAGGDAGFEALRFYRKDVVSLCVISAVDMKVEAMQMSDASFRRLLPMTVGYVVKAPCLCIGLDIAWFGGSAGRPDTQNDCLIYGIVKPQARNPDIGMLPVKLKDRDPDALQIYAAIRRVIKAHGKNKNVVLAVDAPLQGIRLIPAARQKVRRFCEDHLSTSRQAIDRAMAGAKRWHPTIQPGIPLPHRVQKLLSLLVSAEGMKPWTSRDALHGKLIIECFPAEAIWAAKRLGRYEGHQHGTTIKSYKKQQGQNLSAEDVHQLVSQVLLDGFEASSGLGSRWPELVNHVITLMLKRDGWRSNGNYRGGKLLDDVIDSTICFATALSYAQGNAHVWHDTQNPKDGHIIGPGPMQNLFTGRTPLTDMGGWNHSTAIT